MSLSIIYVIFTLKTKTKTKNTVKLETWNTFRTILRIAISTSHISEIFKTWVIFLHVVNPFYWSYTWFFCFVFVFVCLFVCLFLKLWTTLDYCQASYLSIDDNLVTCLRAYIDSSVDVWSHVVLKWINEIRRGREKLRQNGECSKVRKRQSINISHNVVLTSITPCTSKYSDEK